MKWKEWVTHLEIPVGEPWTDSELQMIAYGSTFRLLVHHEEETKLSGFVSSPETLECKIEQVTVFPTVTGIKVRLTTYGELPPGFRRGTYTLHFSDVLRSDALPDALFEDEDVPVSEQERWAELA